MFWLTKFFTKGKSVKDAIKYFHTINGRPPSGIETIRIKNAFMEQNRQSNVIDITSRIKDDWWKQRSGFKRQHPEVTKKTKESDDLVKWFEETTGEKVDTDTYSALLQRQGKELEGIDKNQGIEFYSNMSDMMKRHSREELEFKYDEMFNKILEKAKRIDRDPKVLLEAELGKKLTGEETTTQLLDIFKNRPKKASGGIARAGMFVGGPIKLAKGAKWFLNSLKKNVTDLKAGHPRFKVIPAEEQKMLIGGYETFIKKLEAGGEIPKEALEAISKNPQYYKTKKVVRSQDPDLAEVEELIDEKVFGHVRQELKDLETVGRKSNASGGRVPLMYGGDPGFAFEYGGSWADWHDQHRNTMPVEQYIKTKLPKARLPFREMQSGGLAYMLGEPTYMKYGVGGSVGHGPWHKPTGQAQPPAPMDTPTPNIATRPDPMKAPRGLPSLAPKNMDPAYMQQQMMQKAMMGRGAGNTGQGPRTMANEGGLMRTGFKKGGDWSRRKFLQFIGGAAALPIVGKYFKAAKLAKPAAAVTETIIKSNAPGMPSWFPLLVKRVLKEGEDISKGAGAMERQTVHRATLPSGTPLEVTSDLTKGDVIVDIGLSKHGFASGKFGQPVRLELKKGEWIESDITKAGKVKGKGVKTKDEFWVEEAEFTGGHPENIKFEESSFNEFGKHESDFSEVEAFAKGKTKKGSRKISESLDKQNEDLADHFSNYPEPDDYAKGGLAGLLGE